MTTTPTTTPKPKRRWLQFSLRTLMVLMLVLGCGFGWLGMKVKQAREQREAVKAIRAVGGDVVYDYQEFADDFVVLHAPKPSSPEWLRERLGEDFFHNVVRVNLHGPKVGADCLAQLRSPLGDLRHLRRLKLFATNVTDAELVHLRALTQVTYLLLNESGITDAGLSQLARMLQLQELDLSLTSVTDEGVKKFLQGMPNCRVERRTH
jgi:Leucine Rich repeat